MVTDDETIHDIMAFFQARHYYPGPTATPTSQISSPDAPSNLNPDLRSEELSTAATSAPTTTCAPLAIFPTAMTTLSPEAPFSYTPEEPTSVIDYDQYH